MGPVNTSEGFDHACVTFVFRRCICYFHEYSDLLYSFNYRYECYLYVFFPDEMVVTVHFSIHEL